MKFQKLIGCGLAAVMAMLLTAADLRAEVVVIVHPSNASALDANAVSRLFMGKMKKFPGGGAAEAINQVADAAPRQEFEGKVLKKNASQLKAYWAQLVFSGKAKPPQELGDDAAVKAHVAKTPGAIGYIDAAALDGSVKEALRVK